MEKMYGLTITEFEIMDYIWQLGDPIYFKDLLHYFNTVKGKAWKKQTLSTFLKILQERRLIATTKEGIKYKYYSSVSKEEHIHEWTVKLCETSFDNSIGKLISAYSGGERISKETADELREYLKRYE